MAPTTIRKALGAVKDQTSISIAKVSSNIAPELDVLVVKTTSHDDEPAEERHIREILAITYRHRPHVAACVYALSKRLSKTRDWVVAAKTLMLIHRLLSDGDPGFRDEVLHGTRRGARLLNLSDFRDEAHSSSWDHSSFVRAYALYLDQFLECDLQRRKSRQRSDPDEDRERDRYGDRERDRYGDRERDRYGDRDRDQYGDRDQDRYGDRYGDRERDPYGERDRYDDDRRYNDEGSSRGKEKNPATPMREMTTEDVLFRMSQLQLLFNRFLACRPTGKAKTSRMVLVALYPIVRESFQLYSDVREALAVVLDRFPDLEHPNSAKAFDTVCRAAKQVDELKAFYAWCKDTGVARSSEFPEVEIISDKLLESLEDMMRDKTRRTKSPEDVRPKEVPPPTDLQDEEEPVQDMNSIKALPPPEGFVENEPVKKPEPEKKPPPPQQPANLVDLRPENASTETALVLFSAGGSDGKWETFGGSSSGEPEVKSAWENPAAEAGKADWELALVETTSNLSKQKASMAGGLDPVLLEGMYDHGTVRQHVSAQAASGSSSSVALPAVNRGATQVLALPAPDGSVQTIGGDPFAASLVVPPPSYVQMAEVEKKQQLLVQEQQLWQQYSRDGMQGQVSLAKLSLGQNYMGQPMPYGMPQPMPYGMPPVAGGPYYYAPM